MDRVLFSSAHCVWATPDAFFEGLDREFGFTLDVCANAENAKCKRFYTEFQDGLSQVWEGVVWMNPPYGKTIGKWVQKAYESSVFTGATVVCLLPARVDTRWFHEFCLRGEVRFIKGRLKFGGAVNNAPFPSMVVIFRGCL